MHALHLLSNRKWTERAEPAADLAVAQRAAGVRVTFGCGRLHGDVPVDRAAETRARQKGLDLLLLDTDKHFRVRALRADLPRLRAAVTAQGVGVLHAHMENAHLLAAWAARGCRPRPKVVYSSYEADGPPDGLRTRILLRWHTDGIVAISESARDAIVRRYGFPRERIAVIEPGIDLTFFDPARAIERADRASFGLPERALVVGVLSRLRADRRVDLVLRAAHAARRQQGDLHVLICGHGEGEAEVRRLAGSLGGEAWVTFAGYVRGDRLAAAFRVMDLLAYPAHGTDQSCRTVREALASGTPVAAVRRGFAGELVAAGRTGWLLDEDPAAWAELLQEVGARRDGLSDMRAACVAEARKRFDLALQAERTLAFYRAIGVD